tara:strand:- start:449 stop:784 length:336 start_codon:yes stop_codon:yes gene_type:complete
MTVLMVRRAPQSKEQKSLQVKQPARLKEMKLAKQLLEERKEEDVVIEEEVVEDTIEEEVTIEEEEIMKIEAEVEVEEEVAKAVKVVMETNSIEIRDHELQDHPKIKKIAIS